MAVVDRLLARPRLLVAAAAVLPFLGTLGNEPVLDDGWAALDNPLVWRLGNAGRIFRELYGYAGDPSVRGPYRPLTTLSYALDWAVHGRWTPGFHAVNVALHALASLLVLALARRLFGAAGGRGAGEGAAGPGGAAEGGRAPSGEAGAGAALVAALVFALHPAHVEAVATISGRTEPLSACCALGALLLALGRRRARWRLPAAVLALAAGVLSKEVALVAPALFLLVARALPGAAGLEATPGLATPAERRALARAGGVAAALGISVLPYLAGRGPSLAAPSVARWFGDAPASAVALTMSRVLGEYWRILALPAFLGGDFAYAARLPTLHAPTVGFWAATLAWLALLGGGLWLLWRRRAPLLAVGILWTFAGLLPVLQLVPVGVLLAERLLYLPSVGFCLAAAEGWRALRERGAAAGDRPGPVRAGRAAGRWWRRPGFAAAVAGAVLALLAARTVARTLDWRTALDLWSSEAEKAPREVVVNNNLAVELTRRGRTREAVARLRVALDAAPGYWRAHVNLGIALLQEGDRAGARRALEAARSLAPAAPDPPFWLARVAEAEGDLAGAAALLAEARRLAPEQGRLARAHAGLLLRLGRRQEAVAALRAALALDPDDAEARRLLAEAGGG